MTNQADGPEAPARLAGDPSGTMPVTAGPRSMPGRIPVTAEQRDQILKDPLVRQTLELFDGAIVNMEREIPAATPEMDGSEEPTE